MQKPYLANVSVFKSLFGSKETPFILGIDEIYERIKCGYGGLDETINKIRTIEDKNQRNEYKKKLKAIIFAGEFSQRDDKSLIKHSGFMITDFDGFENEEVYNKWKEYIINTNNCYMLFRSPSGNGFKAVIRIPESDIKTHSLRHEAFGNDCNCEYFDISNKNVSRVCFESYDPDIYLNQYAEEYTNKVDSKGFVYHEKPPLIVLDNETEIINRIMKFDFGGLYSEGNRNNYLFKVACCFNEYGISKTTCESYLHSNVANDGFDFDELLNVVKSAYRKSDYNTKYFEDEQKLDYIKKDLNKGKKYIKDKYKIEDDVIEEITETFETIEFWYYKQTKSELKVIIDPMKYKMFLESNGFKKYFPNGSIKPNFVRVKSNKVVETSSDVIKDFVLNYLEENKKIDVWSYMAGYHNVFHDNYLTMLETIELKMLKDTKDTCYIAYKNGVLEVKKDSCKLIKYIDIDFYIWENQIINRNFTESSNLENDYKKFISNISKNKPLAVECTLGYLISTYKTKMKNCAVILNDENITDNPEGGTGKGLFVQGIQEIRRTSILDGKSFDEKKSFPYQTVNPETQVLVFDDVKKNFDFESKFSLVTEGITLERKNKDAIKLSVEDSPKLLISTNYAIKGEGNSHDRRRHELEFAQYYNGKFTPFDEFKRQLFDDWSEEEWISFDNYMISCVQKYFNYGLIEQESQNIRTRKFIAETSFEFFEWAEDIENLPINRRNDKQEFYEQFIKDYKDYAKWLSRKKFNIWVKKYSTYARLKYEEGNIGGSRWFILSNGLTPSESFDADVKTAFD